MSTGEPTTWDVDRRGRGVSAEYATMSEFIIRGFNVAVPIIDDGDDVVILDKESQVWRVQIKSSTAKERQDGHCSCEWYVPQAQVRNPDGKVALWYCLVTRHPKGYWSDFLILPRDELRFLIEKAGIGRGKGKKDDGDREDGQREDEWRLPMRLYENRIEVSAPTLGTDFKIDLQVYRSNWEFKRYQKHFDDIIIGATS